MFRGGLALYGGRFRDVLRSFYWRFREGFWDNVERRPEHNRKIVEITQNFNSRGVCFLIFAIFSKIVAGDFFGFSCKHLRFWGRWGGSGLFRLDFLQSSSKTLHRTPQTYKEYVSKHVQISRVLTPRLLKFERKFSPYGEGIEYAWPQQRILRKKRDILIGDLQTPDWKI